MDHAANFDSVVMSSDLQSSLKLEQIDENVDMESFECFVDNFSFKCVWQQPDVDMEIINQFMEEINIYDSNEYGDHSPSDILALLSSSFPSGPFNSDEELPIDVVEKQPNDMSSAFSTFFNVISSTPIFKGSNELSISKRSRDELTSEFLIDASPIMRPVISNKRFLTRKRLQMSFESDDDNGSNKKVIRK